MIKKIIIALTLAAAMLTLSIAVGLGVIHLTNFIYYIDVLKDSNRKSWILLTVFTSLCMYTHYILVFPLSPGQQLRPRFPRQAFFFFFEV